MGYASWGELINDRELFGRDIEYQLGDEKERGPIMRIDFDPHRQLVTFITFWTAKYHQLAERWYRVRAKSWTEDITMVGFEEVDGQITFPILGGGRITIYPKGESLNPEEVLLMED